MRVFLVNPSRKYWSSFRRGLIQTWGPHVFDTIPRSARAYIAQAQQTARGRRLAAGAVARSEWWLVDGRSYIGRIEIRHKASGRDPRAKSHVYYEIIPSRRARGYATLMLQLARRKAASLGLKHLLISSDPTNIASVKVIANNGGRRLKSIIARPDRRRLDLYRVPLPKPPT